MSMLEKRTHKRVRVNMKVAYRDYAHAYRIGLVCDISKGGMYMQTRDMPEVDGNMIASLDAEDFGKIILVQGQVVWKTRSGLGIKFTKTDEKGLNNILSYRRVTF